MRGPGCGRNSFLYHGIPRREDFRRCVVPRSSSAYTIRNVSTFLQGGQKALINLRWHDAIRTLAKLHRIDPGSVGLGDFGGSSGFYNRQIKTFSAISASQAQAVDVETKKPVGNIPHFDEVVAFFRDPTTQPIDRGTLVHGDYKIDNLVYHKTEPKVIGILEYVPFPISVHCSSNRSIDVG